MINTMDSLERVLDWQKRNPDKHNAKSRRWYHKHKDEMFKKILDHYGYKCNCIGCDIINEKFLTVDHIDNNGNLHRRGKTGGQATLMVYRDIIKYDFPDSYQILCYNCNYGKNHYGGICPHTLVTP